MSGDHPDWVNGEPVESTALAPAARDADGKVIRPDWSGGEVVPVPAEPASAYLSPAEGQAMVAEMGGDAPASFDALDPSMQAVYVDEAGYDQAQDNIAKIEDSVSTDAFARMDADSHKLPDDAKAVALRLLSLAGQEGTDVIAEYDALSAWLPLSSSAKLREFLVKYDFIKAGG